jgi:hypothetical protein
MATEGTRRDDGPEVSGWAMGGMAFAATVMIIIGMFQIVTGLVAIIDDEFYVVTQNYTFDLDVSAWGWIHLLVGIGVLAAGFGLFSRSPWAGVTTLVLASISAVVNFFFIPYYPFWSLLVIALNIWVIWAITRPGAIRT